VKAAADTFRPNPDFDCYETITKLGTGEALVSTLEEKGVPSMVQRTLIRPPASRLGPVTPEERKALMRLSPVAGEYDETVDRESAFEMLHKRAAEGPSVPEEKPAPSDGRTTGGGWTLPDFGANKPAPAGRTSAPRSSGRQTVAEAAMKSVVRSVSSSLGRALVRGILGSLSRR
jgi:DNA helicase HerA-like ATPase